MAHELDDKASLTKSPKDLIVTTAIHSASQVPSQINNQKSLKFIDTITKAAKLQEHLSGGTNLANSSHQDFSKMLQTEHHLQQLRSKEAYNMHGNSNGSRPVRNSVQNQTQGSNPSAVQFVHITQAQHQNAPGHQQPPQTLGSFQRPGRKVVQRPPSAKHPKMNAKHNSIFKKQQHSNGQSISALQSQSITLRQRNGQKMVQGQPSGSQSANVPPQHIYAVRNNQRDQVNHYLEKRVIQQPTRGSAQQINAKTGPHQQFSTGQLSKSLEKGASETFTDGFQVVSSNHQQRDSGGLIRTSAAAATKQSARQVVTQVSNDKNQNHNGLINVQQPEGAMPIFIKNGGLSSGEKSSTIVSELQKRQLLGQNNTPQVSGQGLVNSRAHQRSYQATLSKPLIQGESTGPRQVAMQSTYAKNSNTSYGDSESQLIMTTMHDSWKQEFKKVRDSLPENARKLLDGNLSLITSIRLDQSGKSIMIDRNGKSQMQGLADSYLQSNHMNAMKGDDRSKSVNSKTVPDLCLNKQPQQPTVLKKINGSLSSHNIQMPGETIYDPVLSVKRQQTNIVTISKKLDDPKKKDLILQEISEDDKVIDNEINNKQIPIAYNKQHSEYAPSGEQKKEAVAVPGESSATYTAKVNDAFTAQDMQPPTPSQNLKYETSGSCPTSKRNMKKTQRPQNRPKSGIPLNRAPFKPSGFARPLDIITPSKRNQFNGQTLTGGSKQFGTKSGTLGRAVSSFEKEGQATQNSSKEPPLDVKQRVQSHYNSRRGVTGKVSMSRRGDLDNQSDKDEEDSYGVESYDYDNEVSYYSDDDDEGEEAKEQLEYDNGDQFTPEKSSQELPSALMSSKKQDLNVVQARSKNAPGQHEEVKVEDEIIKKLEAQAQYADTLSKQRVSVEFAVDNDTSQEDLLLANNAQNKINHMNSHQTISSKEEKVLPPPQEGDDLPPPQEGDDVDAAYQDTIDQPENVNQDRKNLFPNKMISPPEPVNNQAYLQSKSPDVLHVTKRKIKILAQDAPSSISQSHDRKPANHHSISVSNSAKMLEAKNTYMEANSSRKSIQLSESCPKENLVRQLYQRPGIRESFAGLNARLQSMSVRRSDDNDTESAYKMLSSPKQTSSRKQFFHSKDEATRALVNEMEENQKKVEFFVPKDPYSQQMPVYLCKSPFTGRPPTVFFQYPPGVSERQKPIDREHIFKMKQNKFKLKYKIAEGVHTYNCVVNSLCWAGFQQTDGTGWNVMWSAPLKPETLRNYDMYKHNNHFPGTWQLGRKDLMYRNISAQMREFGDEYQIVPKTWLLPYDLRIFQKERDETAHKQLWILKPAASSCGRGIKILSKHSSVPKKGHYVINQYIMKPHLIKGFKYDLRIYVLVTSFEPLTIYIYQDGLVRFATQPYTTKNKKSKFAHLTNFSVNKKASNYKKAGQKDQNEENSSKWRLKTLYKAFEAQGLDFEEVWIKIKDLVVKAVISVEPILANNLNRASRNRHICFEVFGFDVIIDHKLKPWLLEVNVLPSLSSSSQLDKKVKTSLMADVFSTIGIVPYNRKKFERDQETNYWVKFSGLDGKIGPKQKKINLKKQEDIDQSYFGNEDGVRKHGLTQSMNNKLGNSSMPESQPEEESEDEENLAWAQTQNNMAQSQSNYVQSKIRSVKELQSTTDYNIEEQLVIVELCEEYCRRGNFELVFPRKATVDQYKKYFKVQRATNTIVWKWLKLSNSIELPVTRQGASTSTRNRGKSLKSIENHRSSIEPSSAQTGQKTRLSVLKDFNIRKNCASHYLQSIQEI